MLSTDRPDFELELAKLCAGFNVPCNPDRISAYWSGLAKMKLSQFVRVVEHALGEDGPEKIPTAPGVWKIYNALKAQVGSPIAHVPKPEDSRDHLLYYANRMFLRHLQSRHGVGPDELAAGRTVVLDLVKWFTQPVLDEDPDANPFEFITQLLAGLKRVGRVDSSTEIAWQAMLKNPRARDPFPRSMARPLRTARSNAQQELLGATA